VNADNKIGDTFASGPVSKVRVMDVVEDHKKVAQLEATVAALAAQLKEQAAQIQKVNAQLEMSKPTANVVLNNP
jgi:multidrug resistance efflux pump